jgi:shikimate dehydrogenase
MNITGTTELIAHIGFPTHAFKAPLIYNPYFASAGIDAVVVPMGCDAPNYERVLRSVFVLSNIRGALITMPHKVSTVALLDEASLAVQIAGACNAVKRAADGRLVGDLFDGEGFVRGVRRKGVEPMGQRVLIVGAGGVGCAIAAAFAAAEVGALTVFDARAAAAESLAQRLRQHYPRLDIRMAPPDPAGHDIVVNATPLGMQPGDPLPLDTTRLQPSMLVGDVVMREETTALLAAAQARGCRTQVGLDMLFEQIPAYLAFFGLPVASADTLRQLARLPGQPVRSSEP